MPMQMAKRCRKRESDGGGGSVPAVIIPHDLVVDELLTRLPAKSLMRFKRVSKLWHSTITDPSFCKAHRTARSCFRRGLLNDYEAGVLDLLHRFTVGGVIKKEEEAIDRGNKYDGVTEVVNGLFVCTQDCRATICNVSTREIMELPSPPPRKHKSFKHCKYHLGFDSARNQYKLLKVCSFKIINQCADRCISECEILTSGKNAAWGSIQLVDRRMDTWLQSVYVHAHGALYWWNAAGYGIVAFSFEEEIFLPLVPQPPILRSTGSLHQFGDYLAVATFSREQNFHFPCRCNIVAMFKNHNLRHAMCYV
ncbi:hypothetical protein RHSIM_Rhsim08G0032700 [Rhododendron simsii]|uniref:F-box domain-containing protein n=1 Tax=Rhododendron simsii TaxID=118357 RepID=A0A834GL07_RHOSS|nr:hypothetical protein RHSIM_Rhsim08G0032700 [Rhododendron simsii]